MSRPGLDPVALGVYDVYIVNDHGVELKAKALPLIDYAMFWDLNCHRWYIGASDIYYVGRHVNTHHN